MNESILITGVAGFIGATLAQKCLALGKTVYGIDNVNDYYDVELKKNRLSRCETYANFTFQLMDIADRKAMEALFANNTFQTVIHLAAQPGVRYSVENPHAYIDANITGFLNVLEGCRHHHIKHLVYASSSSVYGANEKLPFSEHDPADHPLSLYGATKRANELMAHSYAHLYKIPCTGLRFFTVYGPWGRPDMALFSFTRKILEGQAIPVFNNGHMVRDFTYVDDIVEGIIRIMNVLPEGDSKQFSPALRLDTPYRIYNIGNHHPVQLKHYIEVLEACLGKKAVLKMMPMQLGDVPGTYADVSNIEAAIGILPHTPVEKGIESFVKWYKEYYGI
jgi:UDP-glucuronate 4-epimerase